MKKLLLITVAVVVVGAVIYLSRGQGKPTSVTGPSLPSASPATELSEPGEPQVSADDSLTAIDQELKETEILEEDFSDL